VSQAVQTHIQTQLADICTQLERNSFQVSELVKNLLHYQLNLRLESDRWSIAECVAHLNLFSEAFLPIISEACEQTRESGWVVDAPFKMDVIGRLLKYALEPPSKWKAVTTAAFEPLVVEPLEQVAPRFYELQSDLICMLRSAANLNLNRIRITSPLSNHVRYNLYSCFLIIAAHQRRHIWQAEQTRVALLESELKRR